MAWFVGQSSVTILLAFTLGTVVGRQWWHRRRFAFAQSDAVRTVAARHATALARHQVLMREKDAALATKDAEIARLRAELHSALLGHAVPLGDAPAPAAGDVVGLRPDDHHRADTEDLDVEAIQRAVLGGETGAADDAHAADTRSSAPPTGPIPVQAFLDVSGADAEARAAAPARPAVVQTQLERIEGIGPRIAAALREAGIDTFSQLAEAEITTLQAALEQAGLRFAPSMPTWSRQARLLAADDEAGFYALTEQLVRGRDVSRNK